MSRPGGFSDIETYGQIRQNFAEALSEQDRGIDELSKIIGRQKILATAIGSEVESQNDLIDDIDVNTGRTRERLLRQTDNIIATSKKDATWPYWLVIVLLLICIIVVASVPKIT